MLESVLLIRLVTTEESFPFYFPPRTQCCKSSAELSALFFLQCSCTLSDDTGKWHSFYFIVSILFIAVLQFVC